MTDEKSDAPATPPARAKSPVNLVRLCGLLLLTLALFLYVHDVSANSRRTKAAQAVRDVAASPTVQVAICTNPQELRRDEVWELVRDPADVSNVLNRLASAEPERRAGEPAFDRVYEIMLVQTNHARSYLRAHRTAGSDELWVSLLEPRRAPDAKEGEPPFIEFEPARVTGLGALLDRFDSHAVPTAAELRAAASRQTAYTNLLFRAGPNGFAAEEIADVPASLRKVADLPLEAAALSTSLRPAPRNPAADLPLSVAALLPDLLRAAQPAEVPGNIEGTDCLLTLFFKDGRFVHLRAALPDAAPADALVGFLEFVSGENGEIRPVPSAPALVPGLGTLLRDALPPAPAPEAAAPAPESEAAAAPAPEPEAAE